MLGRLPEEVSPELQLAEYEMLYTLKAPINVPRITTITMMPAAQNLFRWQGFCNNAAFHSFRRFTSNFEPDIDLQIILGQCRPLQ
jgi:hypothetical protein